MIRPARAVAVLIVEDHPLYRNALRQELEAVPGVLPVATSGSLEDAEEHLRGTGRHRPDLVLLDLHLPGLGGADGVRHVRAAGLPVLVLSAAAEPAGVLDAIAAGAAGYLTKNADGAEIATAVRTVAAGGTYISPTLASYLLVAARQDPGADRPQSDQAGLTERERSILGLVAAGETDRDIAAQLSISVSTVRSHLDRIRHKTGHRRRPDLTRLAFQTGIVPAPGAPDLPHRQG
ncbi:MAG: hypothetical protein AVDCRST_MAG41-1088 [uncultured Corynebacteriales bacterium]|uniref:Two-component transcriptional response regulator, LuxR family n=1 Tax=uncultured Mycobacteriales bacterium TaxID=581187 RepID=A0A6J4HTG2_9ACTN|nr:MAG: hypothetical protein AVDCRST_MAG41-1088 [uncultured Corynebacteriales bacterium]